jgi:hypothetical protein
MSFCIFDADMYAPTHIKLTIKLRCNNTHEKLARKKNKKTKTKTVTQRIRGGTMVKSREDGTGDGAQLSTHKLHNFFVEQERGERAMRCKERFSAL